MEERNSERKLTVAMVVTAVVAVLIVAGEQVIGMGVLEPNGAAAVIIGALIAVAKAVGDYSQSRPAKHMALLAAKESALKAASPEK